MRKLPLIIAGAGVALAIAAPVVIGDSNRDFRASLNGYLETPSVSTTARGSFSMRIHASSITYRLTFRDLSTPTLFAHIHFARPDVMGGVAAFLCGGGGKPACGTPSGMVTGTIVPTDVVGPAGQGIAAGEFAELVRAIRNGATYVNVHSEMFPGGEIRGNIRRVDN
jgi:CHRD domain-containing protein